MNERPIHQIFEISVLLKGVHALIECIGGLVLAFVSTSAITGLVNALTQEELIEDPKDFVAAHLLGLVQTFTDVIVMGLIWHEYRLVRRHLTSP